jgi:predicted nucleic acid-binding protein
LRKPRLSRLPSALRTEVEEFLIRKFGWTGNFTRIACQPLWAIARQVRPKVHVTAAVDPVDDLILEYALEANAEIIVTGDRDLLRLGTFRAVTIMIPAAFLRQQPWVDL